MPAIFGIVKPVTVKLLPSTSVALANKPEAAATVSGVSSVTALVSLPSTGASFTGVTVIMSVELSPTVAPLSSDNL